MMKTMLVTNFAFLFVSKVEERKNIQRTQHNHSRNTKMNHQAQSVIVVFNLSNFRLPCPVYLSSNHQPS